MIKLSTPIELIKIKMIMQKTLHQRLLKETIDIFSTFRSRAKELEINEESINKIEKNLIKNF